MKKTIILILALLYSNFTISQTQLAGIPIELNLNGWQVMQDDFGNVLLGHQSTPGIIVISEHAYTSMTDLKEEVLQGANEEAFSIFTDGSSTKVENNQIYSIYSGNAEGQAIKANLCGEIADAPYCRGITIMSIVALKDHNTEYAALIKSMLSSIKYIVPKNTTEWKNKLNGKQLMYRDSYSSSTSGDEYYVSVSSSTTLQINFCSNGSFTSIERSYSSMGGTGLDGDVGSNNDQSEGTWLPYWSGHVHAVKLIFNDGSLQYYPIEYEDGYIYADGKKFTIGPSEICD